MKRLLSWVLSISIVIAGLPIGVQATDAKEKESNTIRFEDGSYITIELNCIDGRASGTKTGSKTYRYYNNDVEVWRAVLRGTFTYTGSSATCTASSCDVTISDSSWYVSEKTVNKSGNAALCELTMGKKFLGVTIKKETINMQITCDANGNLS